MLGGFVAARWARSRELATEPLYTIVGLAAIGGVIGARLFYVLEHGGSLMGTHGYTFFGGVILAGLLIAGYVWGSALSARYLDAAALGLPLGVAIGRFGDVINGEHYGAASNFFLAVRNSSPHALTPNPHLAYRSGGLFEALLGLAIFALVWPLRDRLREPGSLAWLVVALFDRRALPGRVHALGPEGRARARQRPVDEHRATCDLARGLVADRPPASTRTPASGAILAGFMSVRYPNWRRCHDRRSRPSDTTAVLSGRSGSGVERWVAREPCRALK